MSDFSPPPSASRQWRVLYLEQRASLRIVLTEHLSGAGYEVHTAPDGVEGWRKFCTIGFDLVITDLDLPNLDGLSFIRLVRETKRPTRIIVYSAGIAESDVVALGRLRIDASVPKGSDWQSLRDAIAAVMRSGP